MLEHNGLLSFRVLSPALTRLNHVPLGVGFAISPAVLWSEGRRRSNPLPDQNQTDMTAPLRVAYLLVYSSGSHPYTHRELLGSIVACGGVLCTEERRGLTVAAALAVNPAGLWIESENDLVQDLRHVVEEDSFLADLDP